MSLWTDLTLAELKVLRKNLAKAIATGVRQVDDGSGRSTTYRSLSDMRAAAAEIGAEIDRRGTTTYRTRQIRLQPTKGFE